MPSLTKENSAQILDQYLKEHGIKKSYLAKKMNMSPSNLTGYLNGTLRFTAEFAFGVADALNISPSIFLNKSYKF